MTWKAYAAMSGAGLLATYLVSTPPVLDNRSAVTRPVAGTAAPRVADDIEQQAERLGARVREAVEYVPPARNPFRFGGRPAAPRGTTSLPEAATAPVDVIPNLPEAPPPPPPIRLTGIATTTVDGQPQRSAVLLTPEGVVSVREGETAGAYRVRRVEEEAVEVEGPDGVPRRLLLRP